LFDNVIKPVRVIWCLLLDPTTGRSLEGLHWEGDPSLAAGLRPFVSSSEPVAAPGQIPFMSRLRNPPSQLAFSVIACCKG